jgi:hypothetical protein
VRISTFALFMRGWRRKTALTMSDAFQSGFWAILELMGHRRLAGKVTEEERFGVKMCRIDIPQELVDDGAPFVTQYYGGGAIYCLTPSSEAAARVAAKMSRPGPVHAWELPALPSSSGSTVSSGKPEQKRCLDCASAIEWDETYCDKCLDERTEGT